MASDASIYSMIRPQAQQAGPLDQYAQAMQVRHMLDQGDLAALQRKKITRDLDEEEATSAAYRESGGDPAKLRDILFGKGLFRPAMAAEKAGLERETAQATLAGKKAEVLQKSLGVHRDLLASVDTPQAAAQWVASGFADPVLAPVLKRIGSPEELVARIPQDPAQFREWKMKNGLGIEKMLELTAPKPQAINAGGQTVIREMNANAPGFSNAPIAHTATPGDVMSDRRGWASLAETKAEHGRVAAREAAKLEGDKFGQPFEASGPDGKPGMFKQNKRTGEVVPVSGIAPKMDAAAQKQLTGVANTRDAITEYRDALKGFGTTDILNPNARAKMGTFYNNMLLQAKEAYNLGVLNGPDYAILTDVITPPTSLKGGITSKEALDEQAAKLDEIMSRIGKQVTATQTGASPYSGPDRRATTVPQGFKVIRVERPSGR